MKFTALLIISLSILGGCKENPQEMVESFEQEDFDSFRGITVYYRSAGDGLNTSIYFINRNDRDCGPYVITVRRSDNKVLKISNHLLTYCNSYFDEPTIDSVFGKFLDMNIGYLKVDTVGNVYINPYEGAEPTLIRVTPEFDKSKLNSYQLIKDKWYIQK